MLAIIDPEGKIKYDTENRNEDDKKQVSQCFDMAAGIINDLQTYQYQNDKISDLDDQPPIHGLKFSGLEPSQLSANPDRQINTNSQLTEIKVLKTWR